MPGQNSNNKFGYLYNKSAVTLTAGSAFLLGIPGRGTLSYTCLRDREPGRVKIFIEQAQRPSYYSIFIPTLWAKASCALPASSSSLEILSLVAL